MEMKISKILICPLVALCSAVLIACGPLEFEEYPDGTPVRTVEQLIPTGDNALSVETQLILGTLRLEDTDLAVDAQQAAGLLPLWQEWHDLPRGDAAVPADREALLGRIQSAMTKEQLRAIAAMELTQADIYAYMENAYPTPAGGLPGFDQTQTMSPDEMATLQSVYRGFTGGSRGPESMLLHALLDLLEEKIPT
jgi:hypothetical protein